jgi:hypothetical protein
MKAATFSGSDQGARNDRFRNGCIFSVCNGLQSGARVHQ